LQHTHLELLFFTLSFSLSFFRALSHTQTLPFSFVHTRVVSHNCSNTLSRTFERALALASSLTLSVTHTIFLILALTATHTHTHTHTHCRSHSLSLSHSPTHTAALNLSRAYTHTHFLFQKSSLSLTHEHTLPPSFSHTRTPLPSKTLSLRAHCCSLFPTHTRPVPESLKESSFAKLILLSYEVRSHTKQNI